MRQTAGVLPSCLATFFDHLHHMALGVGLRVPMGQLAQNRQRQGAAGPGAVVLGREVGAGQGLQIGIDVGRADGVALAVFIQILKQVLPGNFHGSA